MPSSRTWRILAALSAAAAIAGFRGEFAVALSDSTKDDLAEGDWTGEKSWQHVESGGAGTSTPAPSTTTPAPTAGGTATPAPSGTSPGTATEPTGTTEPTEPSEPAEPTGPSAPGTPDPTGSTPPLSTIPSTCNARWVVQAREPVPVLFEEATLLTLTLFRTDAFAFVSNGFCRSESTWYADCFATTLAGHDGLSTFLVEVRLENPCPSCAPKIELKGISQLQAKVQAKTPWGCLNGSSAASASASTTWAGDVDCGDRCAASIAGGLGTGEISVGADPLKITKRTSSSYVLVDVAGGKGDGVRLNESRTSLMIMDRGGVSTYAAGTDDNVQAKTRAGYALLIQGDSACGKWGEYRVHLRD